jgi:hypothetical protein
VADVAAAAAADSAGTAAADSADVAPDAVLTHLRLQHA